MTDSTTPGTVTARGDTGGEAPADDLAPDPAGQRIRELARLSHETADAARALLARFRALPGGTESARAAMVLGGLPRGGTDEAGFTVYEGTTGEGALSAAVRHLEYAERMLGGHARAAGGDPVRLTCQATRDPERMIIVASDGADGSDTVEAGWAQLIRQADHTRQWRAYLTGAAAGPSRGSMGDYESCEGLLEALSRRAAKNGPWWTDPGTSEPGAGKGRPVSSGRGQWTLAGHDELGFACLAEQCPACAAQALIINEEQAAECLTCGWREEG